MNCDSYFEPANQNPLHPCQDYALAEVVDDKFHYGIIADGCSSSKHSEVGAQILCHVAKHFLLLFYKSGVLKNRTSKVISQLFKESISKRADELRKLYDINADAIDATLWITYSYDGEFFCILGWGDGYLITIDEENKAHVTSIEYESNAPYYLSYNCSPSRSERYKQEFGKMKMIERVWQVNSQETEQQFTYDTPFFTTSSAKAVIVCSDGMGSYMDIEKNSIDVKEIIPEVIGYKRVLGEFLKSNMVFFKRKNSKEGITHYDDISCAAIVKGL